MTEKQRNCLVCESTNLLEGEVSPTQHFKPVGRFFIWGYVLKGLMCLECGFVTQCVQLDDLKRERVWRSQSRS